MIVLMNKLFISVCVEVKVDHYLRIKKKHPHQKLTEGAIIVVFHKIGFRQNYLGRRRNWKRDLGITFKFSRDYGVNSV